MFTLILGIIVIIITLMLISIFFVFIFKSVFLPSKYAPYINSFQKDLKAIKQLDISQGAKILDLGCGDAKALRFFCKHFNIDTATGYDINPYAILIGKAINQIKGFQNIKIHKKNFLKATLKDYNYIYLYLLPKQMAKIENWIRDNKNKETIIISNSFQFKEHKPLQTIKNSKGKNSIFLYK